MTRQDATKWKSVVQNFPSYTASPQWYCSVNTTEEFITVSIYSCCCTISEQYSQVSLVCAVHWAQAKDKEMRLWIPLHAYYRGKQQQMSKDDQSPLAGPQWVSIRLADIWDGISWLEMETILNSLFIHLRNERQVVSEQSQASCGSNNNQQFTGGSLTILSQGFWPMQQERVDLLSALRF